MFTVAPHPAKIKQENGRKGVILLKTQKFTFNENWNERLSTIVEVMLTCVSDVPRLTSRMVTLASVPLHA